ncbi:hypothetical protein [Polyangium aurulentum]|uniref:hypothetical protein n=1 Tax=Polyangium aurulentum TaxID=2567896 RepID=UPI00146E7999|nr:hypothetical protein [Polyangium aurulentum]UQA62657.1 hypothetical protein E8A73_020260 [Polyangium aurulentum]
MSRSPVVFALALFTLVACEEPAPSPPAGTGGSGGGGVGGAGGAAGMGGMGGMGGVGGTGGVGGMGGVGGTGGGGGGGGGPSAGQVQMMAFCEALPQPFCAALFACCPDPSTLAQFGSTYESCLLELPVQCENTATLLAPNIDAGLTALDTARLDACVARLQALAAGGGACTEPPLHTYFYHCLGALEGQLAPGSTCDASKGPSHTLCAGGACINGVCEPWLAKDEPCTPDPLAPPCNALEGEFCMLLTDTHRCSAGADAGAACGVGDDAKDGCQSYTCGGDGTCAPISGEALCKGI